jgi:hypothetical protein
MAKIKDTIKDAIYESSSRNTITYLIRADLLDGEEESLLTLSEDSAETNDAQGTVEYWGEDEDGATWRVHVYDESDD